MSPRTRWAALIAVVFVTIAGVIIAAALLTGSATDDARGGAARAHGALGAVTVTAPSEVPAGEAFDVEVLIGWAQAPGVEVTTRLHVVSPWGADELSVISFDERIVVRVPGELTRWAGRLDLIADVEGELATAAVTIVPGAAVDGAVPLAGPRTVIADGADTTMIVAMVRDRFGNPVAEGTAVDVIARRPDGTIEAIPTSVEHLLASVRLVSGTSDGRTTLRVAAPGGTTGPEVEVLEVAGPPVPFELIAAVPAAPADGRTLVEISTSELRDQFGNLVVDGTLVVFRTDGPDGVGSANALTIDGRATVRIEAPDRPGIVTVGAHVGSVQSSAVSVSFEPDVASLDVSVERSDIGVRIEVGPVTTSLGGFVPDGSQVRVLGAGQLLGSAPIHRGRATIEVAATPGDELFVDVLGARRTILVP